MSDNTTPKKLVKNILTRLYEEESTWEIPYRYICHNEFDSNTTKFEALSNARLIVLKTKFTGNTLILLMDIFQAIYDNNYFKFIDSNTFFDDLESPFTYDDIKNEDIANPDNFIKYMLFFNTLHNNEENEKNGKKFIGENEIYSYIPNVEYKYAHNNQKNKLQEIYTIKDILDIL